MHKTSRDPVVLNAFHWFGYSVDKHNLYTSLDFARRSLFVVIPGSVGSKENPISQ